MEPTTRFVIVEPGIVRATIARAILDIGEDSMRQIGQIALQDHQVSAVSRIQASLAEFRCAVLCDPVGTGKTYTALAAASRFTSVLIVAPAVLRPMWQESARLTGSSVCFASFESLSRGRIPPGEFDFVVVDEAHHARNPGTRRYNVLARVARRADVLLMSATPIHNTRRDLVALLSIRLGHLADRLSASALASCVIRRGELMTSVPGMPAARPLIWCAIPEAARIPALIMSLPAPVPPRDGGDGGILLSHSLIRQWSSSNAALRGALRRRLVRAEALIAALEDGAWPSRRELESWIAGDDGVQLSLPGMLAPVTGNHDELIRQVKSHSEAVRELLKECAASDSDAERADLIRRIRATHCDRRIVVFTQFADSVSGLFELLVKDGGVAALSGFSATVAGGTISRDEAISRFAPRASGRSRAPQSQAVTLLLATDILSEGVNLQDAGVVIHLDLPWTPARMEQRLGRLARIGSLHDEVISYAISPPVTSRELVRIDQILQAKMKEAGEVLERFESLESLAPAGTDRSIPAITESIRRLLGTWNGDPFSSNNESIPVAAVKSPSEGFIALVNEGDRWFLVVSVGGDVTDDVACIESLLRACEGAEVPCPRDRFGCALKRASDWLYARNSLLTVRPRKPRRSAGMDLALRRIERAVKAAKTADRSRIAALAQGARAVLAAGAGADAEKEIGRMAAEPGDDLELLRKIAASNGEIERLRDRSDPRIAALLLLIETTPVSHVKKR